MQVLNDGQRYGLLPILIHWLVAFTVFGLFALGLWMVDLGYYDPWYKQGPDLHRSIGVLLLTVMLIRLVLRVSNPPPSGLSTHQRWETNLSRLIHWAFYVMVPLMAITGYLITTADGRGLLVFDWFEIPAIKLDITNQEDLAGEIHWYLALTFIGLAALHVLGALKHHFIDRDTTLRRIIGI